MQRSICRARVSEPSFREGAGLDVGAEHDVTEQDVYRALATGELPSPYEWVDQPMCAFAPPALESLIAPRAKNIHFATEDMDDSAHVEEDGINSGAVDIPGGTVSSSFFGSNCIGITCYAYICRSSNARG